MNRPQDPRLHAEADRCRHGSPACARCRRAGRLRAVLAIIRGAELGAGVYLPIAAADLDPSLSSESPRRRRGAVQGSRKRRR